jgi:endonuclease III
MGKINKLFDFIGSQKNNGRDFHLLQMEIKLNLKTHTKEAVINEMMDTLADRGKPIDRAAALNDDTLHSEILTAKTPREDIELLYQKCQNVEAAFKKAKNYRYPKCYF